MYGPHLRDDTLLGFTISHCIPGVNTINLGLELDVTVVIVLAWVLIGSPFWNIGTRNSDREEELNEKKQSEEARASGHHFEDVLFGRNQSEDTFL